MMIVYQKIDARVSTRTSLTDACVPVTDESIITSAIISTSCVGTLGVSITCVRTVSTFVIVWKDVWRNWFREFTGCVKVKKADAEKTLRCAIAYLTCTCMPVAAVSIITRTIISTICVCTLGVSVTRVRSVSTFIIIWKYRMDRENLNMLSKCLQAWNSIRRFWW